MPHKAQRINKKQYEAYTHLLQFKAHQVTQKSIKQGKL